jgi:hypothetical protein
LRANNAIKLADFNRSRPCRKFYNRFIEGFDIADLKLAEALLDELGN